MTNSSVNFRIEIYDKAGTCLLYSEEHNGQNLSNTRGGFSLPLGRGTGIANNMDLVTPTAMTSKIFENVGVIAGGWTGCLSGANLADGEERLIRVYYDAGSGLTPMNPDVPLVSSAYAMVADTLQGLRPADLVQIRDDVSTKLSQANLENIFSATNYPRLDALVNGTSSQYMVSNPSTAVGFNNQRISNVATPTAASDAATKSYADGNIGGFTADVSGIGPAVGDGRTLIWDQAAQKWTTGTPSAIDNSKLPLAGGTMAGPIDMASNNLVATGHITMSPQKVLNLGTFTSVQETAMVATLLPTNAGASWYNSTDKVYKIWDGTAAIAQVWSVNGKTGGAITLNANDLGLGTAALENIGTAAGEIPVLDGTGKIPAALLPTRTWGDIANGAGVYMDYRPNNAACANDEILRWDNTNSRWICGADVTAPTGAAGGDLTGSYPNPTIALNAVTTTKLNDGAITTPKLFANPGVNRLVATDSSSGATLKAFECTSNEIMQWGGSGWACVTVGAALGTGYIVDGGNTRGAAITIGTNDSFDLNFEVNNSVKMTIDVAGKVGIGTATPGVSLDLGTKTDSIAIPSGTTAQRPSTPANGFVRYNTDMKGVEAYVNGGWQQVSSGTSPTASEDGKSLRWNDTTKQFEWFAAGTLGSGVQSINGSTQNAHTLVVGSTGTDFTISTNAGTGAHTFNLPTASAANRGLLSTADWTAFNAKVDSLSNIGTAGVGVYKGLNAGSAELKKINAASSAVTVTDDTVNNEIDIGVNAELAGLSGLSANGFVKRTGAGTYSASSSVSLTTDVSGVLPVANGGTGLSAGTSGGIPYFDSTSSLASSGLLTNYGLMVGGGAGAAPTALGVGGTGTLLVGNSGANPSFSATPTLGVNATTTGKLGLANGAASGATVTIQPNASTTAAYNFTLPVNGGTTGYLLQTDGSGNTTWVAPSSASGNVNSGTANQLAFYGSTGTTVSGLTSANSSVLLTDGSGVPSWNAVSNDNFTQYALLAGRSGGQTINGGTAAGNDLTLDSTANASKGNILLQTGGGNVGIGTNAPARLLHVNGPMRITPAALPTSPVAGELAFDSGSSNALKFYNGSAWQTVGTGNGNGDFLRNGTLAMTGALDMGSQNITNIGTNMTSSAALTIANTGANSLTLSSNGTNATAVNIAVAGTNGGITLAPNGTGIVTSSTPVRVTPTALPAAPAAGTIAFDSGSANAMKYYDGSAWVSIGSGTGDFLKNGSVAMTGALQMGSQNITGVGTSIAASGALAVSQNAGSALTLGNNSGASSATVQSGTGGTTITSTGTTATAVNITATGTNGGITLAPNGTGIVTSSTPVRVTPTALPASASAGTIAFDSGASNALKYYDGSAWKAVNTTSATGDFMKDGSVAMTGALQMGSQNITGIGTNMTGTAAVTLASGGTSALTLTSASGVLSSTTPLKITPTALPGTPAAGMIAFDSGAANAMKYYDGSAWVSIGSGTGDFLKNGSVAMTGALNMGSQNITSVGTNITSSAALTIANTGANSLTLSSNGTNATAVNIAVAGTNGGITLAPNGTGIVTSSTPVRVTPTALPAAPAAGTIAFDSGASNALKYYDGSAWKAVNTTSATGDFMKDGSVAMTGAFNAGTQNLTNIGTNITAAAALTVAPASGSALTLGSNSGASSSTVQSGTGGTTITSTGTTATAVNITATGTNGGITLAPNGTGIVTSSAPVRVTPTALPGSPAAGTIAFDSGSANAMKYYDGSAWVSIGSGTGDFLKNGSVAMTGALNMGSQNITSVGTNITSSAALTIANTGANSLTLSSNGTNATAVNIAVAGTNGGITLAPNGTGIVTSSTPVRVTPTALPAAPAAGTIAFDSGSGNAMKYYDGSAWVALGSGTGDFLKNGSIAMTGNFNAGGNSILGNTTASANLTLESTSHGTKGYLNLQPNGGNVGIGTTVPGGSLHINSTQTGSARTANIFVTSANNTNQKLYIGINSNGGATTGDYASIEYLQEGQHWGALALQADGGNVGIGTTTPGERLEVAGNVKATSFISTSDRRLKTNIQPMSGLDLVTKMNGVRWNWRANGKPDMGVIAQELETILPEAVVTDAQTGYKAVKYGGLVAPLIESTKELYGMCKASEEQLAKLDAAVKDHGRRLASLESENNELKAALQAVQKENAKLKNQSQALDQRMKAIEDALNKRK